MLKTCCIALLGLTTLSAYAKTLANYDEVVHAINDDGLGIRLVMNLKNCQSEHPISIDAIASFQPNALMVIPSKHVTFSNLRFTTSLPRFKNRPVYEHTKYMLTPDNKLTILTKTLSTETHEIIGNINRLTCTINESVRFYSTP